MGTAGQHNYLDFLFLLNLDYYYFFKSCKHAVNLNFAMTLNQYAKESFF